MAVSGSVDSGVLAVSDAFNTAQVGTVSPLRRASWFMESYRQCSMGKKSENSLSSSSPLWKKANFHLLECNACVVNSGVFL